LKALQEAELEVKPQKCEFHVNQVEYLGFIITTNGIRMDNAKVETIIAWPIPDRVRDVRAFLGFGNFYRRFIRAFSRLAQPLTALTKKGQPFVWTSECQSAFDKMKTAFTTAPVLTHFDFEKDVVIETDASDFVSAGIMSQRDDEGILHPVAYYSKKHSPAECNYDIYDKELMAVVRAFEEWRCYLIGKKVTILTYHQNLKHFTTKRLLNRRQARWSEFLTQFNYHIEYQPEKLNGKADALTRMKGESEEEATERRNHQTQVVLKSQGLGLLANITLPTGASPLEPLWHEAYQADPKPNQILKALDQGDRHSRLASLAECARDGNYLKFRNRLYVPNYEPLILSLIQAAHDSPSAGHPGRAKTHELLSRWYVWPGMRRDIGRYVANCHTCQRS